MKPSLFVALVLYLLPWRVTSAATNETDPEKLSFNLKTLVGAYEKVGRRNAKWDEDAMQCLTRFARVRADTNGTAGTLRPEMVTILSRLAEKKCDDPMIRYLHLRYVFAGKHTAAETAAAFEEVAGEIQKSEYPDLRKFYATLWTGRTQREVASLKVEGNRTLLKAAGYLAKALEDKALPVSEADDGCDLLLMSSWYAEGSGWEWFRVLEPTLNVQGKGTSYALLAKARGYLAAAWQARGTGYADKVTQQGAKQFEERLAIAAKAGEAAWALDSHDARICLTMMRIETGQHLGSQRLDTWFERGMKIEPSNYDLCYAKVEYLRPRWYGSMSAMVEFGRECTKNTNWSGNVRLMLADAHYEASREIQDDTERAAYWKQPKVWPDVQLAFEQYFKLYPERTGYRHNYARFAARCEQWQELLDQVKQFPHTNHTYFGGVDSFNQMVQHATARGKAQ